MILHASMSANDPRHVAHVIAELWRGEALPFAPVPGSWIAMAGDSRGSGIEVYPAACSSLRRSVPNRARCRWSPRTSRFTTRPTCSWLSIDGLLTGQADGPSRPTV
jgi:hypothetical protein